MDLYSKKKWKNILRYSILYKKKKNINPKPILMNDFFSAFVYCSGMVPESAS